MKYFDLNMRENVARAKYIQLSKDLHADRGGNDKDFTEMKAEYEDYLAIMKHKELIMQNMKPQAVVQEKVIYVNNQVDPNKIIKDVTGLLADGNTLVNGILSGIKEVRKMIKDAKK